MSVDTGIFFREITMYRDIFPKMEALLDEAGITEDLPWGKCVDIRLYDRLILEDLSLEGYKMADRRKQLGLNASLLVMKAFGKFHGLSRILLQRGELPLDIFRDHMSTKDEDKNRFVEDGLKVLIRKCDQWGDEWKEATRRMKEALPDFGKKFSKALTPEPDEFSVLVHSDGWTNNLLFKYDVDPENSTSVKLLDFQICFLSSPARDLHMFFTTSVKLDVREKHLNTLVQAYADSLKSILTKCNYEDHIPDANEVHEMLEKRQALHFGDSFTMALVALNDHESTPDFEEVMKKSLEAEARGEEIGDEYTLVGNMSPTAEKVIKVAIKQAMKSGVI
ncbi:Protein of unknown function (DUF1679) [Nesidiocoris tenuis]|nr:Protein of unknown function (DUF1679) [Nesidiocoris tenuis]